MSSRTYQPLLLRWWLPKTHANPCAGITIRLPNRELDVWVPRNYANFRRFGINFAISDSTKR